MRIKSLESLVCMVLMGVGLVALMTIGMAEETASQFLLAQERALGALDYQSLPKIYAIALIILCAANIGLLYLKNKNAENTITPSPDEAGEAGEPDDGSGLTPEEMKRRTLVRTVGTAVLLIAYCLIMPFISFFISTAIFLLLLFMLYGKTDLKISLPLSLAGAAFFWVVFIKIANLPIGNF